MPKSQTMPKASPKNRPSQRAAGALQAGGLALVAALFILLALWRAALAASLITSTTLIDLFGAVVVHWQRLDEFVPWMVIGILLLGGPAGVCVATLRQARISLLLAALFAVGIVFTALGIAADQGAWFDGTARVLSGPDGGLHDPGRPRPLAVLTTCTASRPRCSPGLDKKISNPPLAARPFVSDSYRSTA